MEVQGLSRVYGLVGIVIFVHEKLSTDSAFDESKYLVRFPGCWGTVIGEKDI